VLLSWLGVGLLKPNKTIIPVLLFSPPYPPPAGRAGLRPSRAKNSIELKVRTCLVLSECKTFNETKINVPVSRKKERKRFCFLFEPEPSRQAPSQAARVEILVSAAFPRGG